MDRPPSAIALAAWLVSAVLVGKQRRILPGIVLSLVFVGCAGRCADLDLYARHVRHDNGGEIGAVFDGLSDINEPTRAALGAAVNDLPVLARAVSGRRRADRLRRDLQLYYSCSACRSPQACWAWLW
jgi:hypothetical protein